MTLWSIFNACLASVAAYAGLHYLIHYAVRSRGPATLYFALACFSATLYDFSGMGLYSLTATEGAILWQRFQSASLALLIYFLFWWAVKISAKARRPWDYALAGYFLLHSLMVTIYPGEALWSQTPAVKAGSFFGFAPINYYEMKGTFAVVLIQVAGLATAAYALYILTRYLLPTHRDFTMPLLAAVFVLAATGVNDFGFSEGWWSSVYLTEFSFTFLILALAYNITREHIRSEIALLNSLAEKESLLKEIHHRVKNNLQIVSGLLVLNENLIQDPEARELFKESHRRITSMALIHERLYQSSDLTRIDFGAYLRALVENLRAALLGPSSPVTIDLEVQETDMVIDTAIPCGLLVNELITNAMKHAFPDGRSGTIVVAFRRKEPRVYELVVADDGVGLPPDVDIGGTPSLGIKLVGILVDQMGGKMQMIRDKGTTFILIFSEYVEAGTTLY